MRRKRLLVIIIPIVLLGFVMALLYGAHVWWLSKYGASSQPVPSEILNRDRNFNFPKGFSPDPGPDGMKTIQGVDADHDGVRDDVQRWIYAFVPDDVRKRMALRQMARYYQYSVADDYGPEERKRGDEIIDRAIQCFDLTFDDELHGYMENIYLKAKVLNTYDRVARYWSNDDKVTTEEMARDRPEYEVPCDNR